MKKFLAFIFCTLLLVCALSVATFATEAEVTTVNSSAEDETKTTVDLILDYIKAHPEEVSVIVSLISAALYGVGCFRKIKKSISATNYNAITVSENSEKTISEALRAIEKFDSSLLTVTKGNNKKSVVVNDVITVVNSMAQLYMTVVIQ
jgi:hypothetical protein